MKAEDLLKLMESGKYESLTVSEFAQIVRKVENENTHRFWEEVEAEKMNELLEQEREMEEVQRMNDIKEEQERFADYSDQDEEYDRASSNKGELI